jgi:CRISPR-associated protein Csm1
VQIFLQGKLLGIEPFIQDSPGDQEALAGRCLYVSLLSEAIPRALLRCLGLAPELLGSSGGSHFLAVLTTESLPEANAFLVDVTRRLADFSGNQLRLAWAATENLGAWSDVRKRLDDQLSRWRGAGAIEPQDLFQPFQAVSHDDYFRALATGLPDSAAAVWDPEAPGMLRREGEPHWLATHCAPGPDGAGQATLQELASRAQGRKAWGVLRGDADQFSARLRKAQSIEEYIQLSIFFRQFFAGEIQVLCSHPDFQQKTSVLYTGGDEFAVLGSWDALIPFAREIERLFQRSAEVLLKEFAGTEGKTLSMALALAPSIDANPVSVYAEAGRQLEIAKSAGRDSFSVLGRVLDWKQLAEASDVKDSMLRLVTEFGCSPQFLGELGAFYRETDRTLPARASRRAIETQQRPWRLHRRLNRVLEGPERNKEFQKARNTVLAAFLTRGQAQLKLKPSGRVALEWARFTEEAE